MINTIATIISTGVVVGGAVGAILTGFYKTNKQATQDYKDLENKFDKKLESLKKDISHDADSTYKLFKDDFDRLSDKIEDMKTHYVSNENFKTYADTMNQLLQMNSDRMERIENTLDDIRDDLNQFIRGN